jgi:hypothetical protein
MKADDDQRTLLSIAMTIADGHAVDWEGVLANHPEVRPEIESLRLLEAIAKTPRESHEIRLSSVPKP